MIPGAILYDLANGGNKDWGGKPPYSDLGIEAASKISDNIELEILEQAMAPRQGH